MKLSCKTFRNLYFTLLSIFTIEIEKDRFSIHQELVEDVPDSLEIDQVPQGIQCDVPDHRFNSEGLELIPLSSSEKSVLL